MNTNFVGGYLTPKEQRPAMVRNLTIGRANRNHSAVLWLPGVFHVRCVAGIPPNQLGYSFSLPATGMKTLRSGTLALSNAISSSPLVNGNAICPPFAAER